MIILSSLAVLCLSVSPLSPRVTPVDLDDDIAKVIEDYFALDDHTMDARNQRNALIKEIDQLLGGTLDEKAAERWRTVIKEQWLDGRMLEKKRGNHYFWEKEKRGFYIVGGVTKKPRGLLIGMHGGGVGSGSAREASSFLSNAAKKAKFVAIFPEVLEKTEHGWTTSGTEEWVIDLVDAACRTYNVDPNHIVFAGHSMGGFGSWMLGGHHADRVAALGPAAGAPTPYLDEEGNPDGIVEGVIPNLRNIPIRIYQSDDDPQVPPAANRAAVKQVEEAKAKWGGYEDFEYIEVKGKGHAYPKGGGKDWLKPLVKFERDPHPLKIVWEPTLRWKRQFHWLYWESANMRQVVEAEIIKGENTIRLTTLGSTQGLWVLLPESQIDIEKEVIVEVGGAEVWRGIPERKLSTLLMTGVRGDDDLNFSARVPAWK
ncbi:MAG: dienelactone hydrolase [Planctomycetota bacterium]|jgi:dienelactone hydrolase